MWFVLLQTDQKININEHESYVDFQTNMVSVAKKIAMTAQDMVGKSNNNPADLGSLANQLTRDYDLLAANTAGAAAASASSDVSVFFIISPFYIFLNKQYLSSLKFVC